jgi:hypothetical protein
MFPVPLLWILCATVYLRCLPIRRMCVLLYIIVSYSLSNLYSMYKSIELLRVVAPAIMIIAISNVVIVMRPLLYVIEYPIETACRSLLV